MPAKFDEYGNRPWTCELFYPIATSYHKLKLSIITDILLLFCLPQQNIPDGFILWLLVASFEGVFDERWNFVG